MTAIIVVVGLLVYISMYFIYGKYLEKRIVMADPTRPTPAVFKKDGVDYVPAKPLVLFGHHFASIAGAGPIVGPVIALVWGWLPALLWVWFGNVVIGAVHDYLSLMASVRYEGRSIQWVASRVIRERTGAIFNWFVLFVLILVIAAFSAILANLFQKLPQVATASGLFLISALILGVLLYRTKLPFALSTFIGLLLLLASVYGGFKYPAPKAGTEIWLIVLLVYIFLASALPVNVLLQPRDYLNSWLLFAGLLFGVIAVLIRPLSLDLPSFTRFSPVLLAHKPTPFWPMVPLIIACGALSGFHSLVASGTSSKQLDKETSGLFVGYGAMFAEGFLATLVIVMVSAAVLSLGLDKTLPFEKAYIQLQDKLGAVKIFSESYGLVVGKAFGISVKLLVVLASLWVSAFALTSLDTANRLARYVLGEMVETSGFASVSPLITRWIASLLPALIGVWLAFGGYWRTLWPAFSGANQLLASIAFLTVDSWVRHTHKKVPVLISAAALFLWLTVTSALVWYFFNVVPDYYSRSAPQAVAVGIIVVIMLILNFMLFYDYVKKILSLRNETKRIS